MSLDFERHLITLMEISTHTRVYIGAGSKKERKQIIKMMTSLKDDDGNHLFRYFNHQEHLIAVEMMSEGRPDKRTPEYKIYIEPWMRERDEAFVEGMTRAFKDREKDKCDFCINKEKVDLMEKVIKLGE